MNTEKNNTFYDEIYRKGEWNQIYLSDDENVITYSHIWNYIVDLIKTKYKNNILIDLGCGNGQFSRYISNKDINNEYMGYDFSAYAIEYANKNKKKPKNNFNILDFNSMTHRKDSVNSMYLCLEVLEHINNDIELIEKLTPDREYIFSVPNYMSNGHVRIYKSEKEIKQRYSHLLEINEIKKFYIGDEKKNKVIFLFSGKIKNKVYEWKKKDYEGNIELTVSLPTLNAEKIIWLALESLKNQTDINFNWELICLEEYKLSRDIIKSYINKLPGCVRIYHESIDPILDGEKEGIFKEKYLLINKHINIAKLASQTSKIYYIQSSDDYSPYNILKNKYEHFNNKNYLLTTQTKGIFYNITNKKMAIYNGKIYDNIQKKRFNLSTYKQNHVNMAFRIEDIKKIIPCYKNKSIDKYLRESVMKINNISIKNLSNNIYYDDTMWKYGLFTDGYNNISIDRKQVYLNTNKYIHFKKVNNVDEYKKFIPKYIWERLETMK
mgnify:CR=1 FL=1|tara:strand:- start:4539 stop:6017 length:1479 start_codon:yes stop_codon:yes gene_type:complete